MSEQRCVDLSEAIDEWRREDADLRAAVKVRDGCVELRHADGLDVYRIPLDQCGAEAAILQWTSHLLRKRWATPELVGRFIEVALSQCASRDRNG